MSLKCNLCWKELEGSAYITVCSHIFCERDAKNSFSKERVCPTCDSPLPSRGGITVVDLTASQEKTIQLCGLPPQAIMNIASKALEFWQYQKETELEYQTIVAKNHQLQAQKLEQSYNERLLEQQSKITLLTHQVESMRTELENDKKEIAELQERYSEKSRQKRKLAELYEALKRKQEAPTSSLGFAPTSAPAIIGPGTGSPSLGKRVLAPPKLLRENFLLTSSSASASAASSVSSPRFYRHREGDSTSTTTSAGSKPMAVMPTFGVRQETSAAPLLSSGRNDEGIDRFSLLRLGQSPKSRAGGSVMVTTPSANGASFSSPPVRKLIGLQRPETPLLSRRLMGVSTGGTGR